MRQSVRKPSSPRPKATERRSNVALRSLVTEMLERVRQLSRRTAAWSPEERATAERELEMIMARVRSEAGRAPSHK